MCLTIPLCQYIESPYSDVIRDLLVRLEITPAAYIGFPTVTAVTLALGIHRHDYVGYARVRNQGL